MFVNESNFQVCTKRRWVVGAIPGRPMMQIRIKHVAGRFHKLDISYGIISVDAIASWAV